MALSVPTNKLEDQTVSASFDQLLYLDSASGMVTNTLKIVSTETSKSCLSLSENHLLIKGLDTDNTAVFQVTDKDATNVLLCNASTNSITVGNDLILNTDSSIIKFGADLDTTLTHTDGTGLTLNSTNKLCFNDASQFIQGSSATVLSIGATDEIDLTATAIDINSGTIDLSTQTVDVTLNAAVDALNFDSNTLSIDASNNRVGIGTASPKSALEVKQGTNDIRSGIRITREGVSENAWNLANYGGNFTISYDDDNDGTDEAQYINIDQNGN